jgi:ribonuclease R
MAKPRTPKSSKFPTAPKPPQGLPDRETLLAFLRSAGESGKADIARHFGLKGADRRALREMLRELEAQGDLGKRGRKGFAEAGSLPPWAWPTWSIATPTATCSSS